MEDSGKAPRFICISDSVIVLEGMKVLLGRLDGAKTITTCNSLAEIDWSYRSGSHDLGLVAWNGSNPSSAELVRQLRRRSPEIKLIVVGCAHANEMLLESLQAGANAIQLLSCSSSEMADAIRKVLAGQGYIHPDLASLVLRHFSKPEREAVHGSIEDLSPREMQVLRCLVTGMNNEEIGRELVISLPTVHTHVAHILTKLQVASRTQAVILALQNGVKPR
jgi:DNA-binding NarL/FixJ family response regulator